MTAWINSMLDRTLGRSYYFNYNRDGRLTALSDFTGRTVSYGYDSPTTSLALDVAIADFLSGKTTATGITAGLPRGSDRPDAPEKRLNHNLLTISRCQRADLPRKYYYTDPQDLRFDRVATSDWGGPEGGSQYNYSGSGITSTRRMPQPQRRQRHLHLRPQGNSAARWNGRGGRRPDSVTTFL